MATTEDPPNTKPQERQRVHIRIKYPGMDEPGWLLEEQCKTLVSMLMVGDAGVVREPKAGDGGVDIYVTARFVDHTIELAGKIIRELGLADRTTISVVPKKAPR